MQPLPFHPHAIWKRVLLLLFIVLAQKVSHAQCAPSAITVSTANSVLNTYYPATSSLAAGRSVITLGASQGSSTPIAQGDLLLIIQMQGSTLNSTNSDAYGDGVAGGVASGVLTSVAGTYEYAIAANAVTTAGGTLYLTKPSTSAFTNQDYVAGATGQYRYQVIRVPRYSSMTISGAGTITAVAWNGASGGVVAVDVVGALTLAGTTFVNVARLGFRGGAGRQLSGAAGLSNTDYRTLASQAANGTKGEGIAGTPQYIRLYNAATIFNTTIDGYPNGSNAKGAPGNAGGGATDGNPGVSNDQNAGGGGGGNGGAGGLGGRPWSNSNLVNGGYGGAVPSFLSSSRLILGGGGGSGSTNDGSSATGETADGRSSSGGSGGGMVIIRAGSISGTGTINADGQNGYSVNQDGGGGAGAGGTVYITAVTPAGLTGVTVQARGGVGGNAWASEPDAGGANDGNPEHGPGGGGGGGAVYSNGALNAASVVTGGLNGVTTASSRTANATAGAAGTSTAAAAALPNLTAANCDSDDDDDGIPDISENRAGVDPFADADSDGTPNLFDATPGGSIPAFTDANNDAISDVFDTDVDGIINSNDRDADNDGIPDILEQGGTDADNNGIADNLTDANNNGWPDIYEPAQSGTSLATADKDRDGIPNFRDLDADGDGILDVREAGFAPTYDTDNNGVVDNGTLGADGWNDLIDALAGPLSFPNTDTRGSANYLDIDSDDDGITDNVEAQSTAGYLLPTGSDSDLDGIDNDFDNNDALFGGSASNGITPNNQDGAGDGADYIDSDSDNDNVNDLREGSGSTTATLTNLADTDNDGLLDQFDTFNILTEPSTLQNNVTNAGMGAGGSFTGPSPSGSNLLTRRSYSFSNNRDWRNSAFVLPVHFVKIMLNASGNSYTIKWVVAAEVNVRDYTVQRSTDGVTFTAVGKVAFNNYVAAEKTYSYTDNNLPAGFAGTVYYRVVETDNDGLITISQVVSQRVSAAAGALTISGNPVSTHEIVANLSTPEAGRLTITLIDIKGRIVQRKVQQAVVGNNTIRISYAGNNGTYFLKAVLNNQVYKQKVQVSR